MLAVRQIHPAAQTSKPKKTINGLIATAFALICIFANAHKQKGLGMVLEVLAALAEPTRLGAMRILADGGEHCVCEMMSVLGATQSRMSRHVKVLREAGLVVDRRDAQWVRFRLDPNMPPEVRAILDAVLAVDQIDERKAA